MRNFTIKSLMLVAFFAVASAASAQLVTYERNIEISKKIRQSHRANPVWGDFTKNGYMDIYYGGTSGAYGWLTGGFLIQNEGSGNFQMIDEFAYEDYEDTVWKVDDEGNIVTDEEGNWIPEYNEDGSVKTVTRQRIVGMKNGLPKCAYGMGSVVFDYNQDGYVDMLLANAGGNDTGSTQGYILVRNNGDGTFTVVEDEGLQSLGYQRQGEKNFNEGQEQLKVAVGDYDKDGYPDLLITGWSDGRGRHVCLLKNNEGAGFEVMDNIFNPVPYENEINVKGLYVSEEEFDEDGISLGTKWYIDQPTKNIIQCSHGPVAFADFDGDGWLDIFVTGWRDGVDADAPDGKGSGGWDFRFYRNLQNGEFQDITDQFQLNGETVSIDGLKGYGGNLMIYPLDFNQDGKIDIYFNGDTGSQGKVALVFQNIGSEVGQFSFQRIDIDGHAGIGDPTHRLFFVADVNGDDYPEYYVDGWASSLQDWGRVWMVSDATGAYTTESYYQGEVRPCPNGAWLSDGNIETGSWGDFDGDGKLDLIVNNWEDAPWAGEGGEGSTYGYWDNFYVSLNTTEGEIVAPDAPATVSAEVEENNVTVTWDPVYVSNGNQPMYNLYIKNTSTGKTFMIAPANIETGKQEAYTAFGGYVLAGEENKYTFVNVEGGDYEIGVQAVSFAYAGSTFATTTVTVGSSAKPGDVNEDGEVNINDVVAIINVMAGTATWPNANVNEDADGYVDINDVVAVINIMAGN